MLNLICYVWLYYNWFFMSICICAVLRRSLLCNSCGVSAVKINEQLLFIITIIISARQSRWIHHNVRSQESDVWRLRGNIIRTAACWFMWHNVHSPQQTYMSSSYRSNRLGLSHWDPYAVLRGGCLELHYCNMVEWFWWDSSLIVDDKLVSFSALTLLVWSSGL